MAPIQFPRDRNYYELGYQISNGDNAVVHKATCKFTHRRPVDVAIKIIDLTSTEKPLDVVDLINGNISLPQHGNIVKAHCYFICQATNQLWVVMPYFFYGSIQSISCFYFPHGLHPKCIATILGRVLLALVEIHRHGSTHGGVKPGNILIAYDGTPLLSDYGVSSWDYENDSLVDPHGSSSPPSPYTVPYWVPPESTGSRPLFGKKFDIWSFGITALELFHGRPPITEFPELRHGLAYRILKRFDFFDHYKKGKASENKDCPDSFKDLVKVCLTQDPRSRPSSKKLLSHSFFAEECQGEGYMVDLFGDIMDVEQRLKPRSQNLSRPVRETGLNLSTHRRTFSRWECDLKTMKLEPVFHGDRILIQPTERTSRSHPRTDSGLIELVRTWETLMAEMVMTDERLNEKLTRAANKLERMRSEIHEELIHWPERGRAADVKRRRME